MSALMKNVPLSAIFYAMAPFLLHSDKTVTVYFLQGRKLQLYTACRETVLALPLRAACVQHSRFRNHGSIPWQKGLFTKYLILCSFGVSPRFSELQEAPHWAPH